MLNTEMLIWASKIPNLHFYPHKKDWDQRKQRKQGQLHNIGARLILKFMMHIFIDASRSYGHLCRYVNDAPEGSSMCNAKMKMEQFNGYVRLCLYAKRDLIKGEEVRYDYGDNDHNLYWRSQKPTQDENSKDETSDEDSDPFDVKRDSCDAESDDIVTVYNGSSFVHLAVYNGSSFVHLAVYNGSSFVHLAVYNGSTFVHLAVYNGSSFIHLALYNGSSFVHLAVYNGSTFVHLAVYNGSSFVQLAYNVSSFEHLAVYNGSSFIHLALYNGSSFEHLAVYNGSPFVQQAVYGSSCTASCVQWVLIYTASCV
ncbi:hypothetical protein KUTeg_011279 [Tegillarca granosa]|uniref:SET domain-containing protein n=1 Tax=Tegillarca granosa TaxID=220873 RepID=A0ABQ9F1A3_TEGGR|nr:hypothetical protein KUTeg_011279 [Tegillarca granosa]